MEAGAAAAPEEPAAEGTEPDSGAGMAMMYEYAVDMVCEKCRGAVHQALDGMESVTTVQTNVQAQIVVVEGTFAPTIIVGLLEEIGRKVKLIGSGCATAVEKGMFVVPAAVGPSGENSAAVAEFKGGASSHGAAVGTVRFVGLAAGPVDTAEEGPWTHADVTIDGLAPETEYCVEVHKFGDLSKGAESTGPLFAFGVLGGSARKTSPEGRLEILSVLSGHHVWELIGRSIVVRLDLAPGAAVPAEAMACAPVGMPRAMEGSDGRAVAAVIARSAGVGANHKMLCACDGTVIWDAEALMPGGSGRARPAEEPK